MLIATKSFFGKDNIILSIPYSSYRRLDLNETHPAVKYNLFLKYVNTIFHSS
jgi:hypothetical protein